MKPGTPRKNLAGMIFGKLTAIEPARTRNGRSGWLLKCECGGVAVSMTSQLLARRVSSCGCLRVMAASRLRAVNTTHGKTTTRTFKIWTGMRARCSYPNAIGYQNYGGRGIRVCQRWNSFENFLADMGAAPDGMQIDRIDNHGNYEPGNCQWVTAHANSRNRRSTRLLTHNGETKCITDWAAALGISAQAIRLRLSKLGWPLEKALTEGRAR